MPKFILIPVADDTSDLTKVVAQLSKVPQNTPGPWLFDMPRSSRRGRPGAPESKLERFIKRHPNQGWSTLLRKAREEGLPCSQTRFKTVYMRVARAA